MANPSKNPRIIQPNDDRRLGPIEKRFTCNGPEEPSLVDDLGEVVDDLRQMFTDFGARPYRIFCVVVSWSGEEVGRGTQSLLRETELLPTPYIDMSAIRYQAVSGGRSDTGQTTIYEISPRYTEAEIKEMFPRDLALNEQAFVEVRMDGRDGKDPLRHRFTVTGMPARDATGFQYTCQVTIQFEERTPQGQLSERVSTTDVHPLMEPPS